jgi:acyl-CoA thioester hydrolase
VTSECSENRTGSVDTPSLRARERGSVASPVTSHLPAFQLPVRIYWEDTDAGGIVYYANYLKYMERARTEWLRHLGVEQEPLRVEQGLMFVVVHADVHFKKPARYGDTLQVGCTLKERGRASLTFQQAVVRDGTQEVLVEGEVRVACLDAVKLKPRGLPASILQIGVSQIGMLQQMGGGNR